MNLLLLDATDIRDSRTTLRGPRAQHVAQVLKKVPGQTLKAGLADQGTLTATVLALETESRAGDLSVALELGPLDPVAPPRVHLMLALPRPKALSRLLQTAASFGIGRLELLGGYRVDKSYFDSPRLHPERLREDLWLGCEQGAQVWLPQVTVVPSFRTFVEEVLPQRQADQPCRDLLLHPRATRSLAADAPSLPCSTRLALGPEGGWTEGELGCFERAGFSSVTLGAPILKTEAALAATLGQLLLLDALRES